MTRELHDVGGAVVTGAGSGMGKATAVALAQAGAGVVCFDINVKSVQATADEIEAAGGRAVAVDGDVSRVADLQQAADTAIERFGGLGVMVNFAGLADATAPCLDTSEELWDRVLEVNLKGTFLGTKVAVEAMQATGGGSIVNMASYAGLRAGGGGVSYAASKAGVIGFTRQVAHEVAPAIRVNAVAPGLVLTGIFESSAALLGDVYPDSPGVRAAQERLRSAPMDFIPLQRGAEPEEVARLAVFLASEDSSYITGQTFPIDGGASIRNGQ